MDYTHKSHYIPKAGDVLAIEQDSAAPYNGNIFLFVKQDKAGRYSTTGKRGGNFLFPIDVVQYIRINGFWWKVNMIYCEMKDFQQYGTVTYDVTSLTPLATRLLDYYLVNSAFPNSTYHA